jgi:hypothetical protein
MLEEKEEHQPLLFITDKPSSKMSPTEAKNADDLADLIKNMMGGSSMEAKDVKLSVSEADKNRFLQWGSAPMSMLREFIMQLPHAILIYGATLQSASEVKSILNGTGYKNQLAEFYKTALYVIMYSKRLEVAHVLFRWQGEFTDGPDFVGSIEEMRTL